MSNDQFNTLLKVLAQQGERIEEVHRELIKLGNNLSQRIEEVNTSLSKRIAVVNKNLSKRIDKLERRIEEVNTNQTTLHRCYDDCIF